LIHRFIVSKDRIGVDIKLESINPKTIGRDIISGGSFDYEATSKEGYLVTVKPAREAEPKISKLVLSKAFTDLNIESFIMDPTYLSGIITAEIKNIPDNLNEENIVEGIAKTIEKNNLKKSLISTTKKLLKKETEMKIITISEELYNRLEKIKNELQDKDLREYDINQIIEKLLKNYLEERKE